MRERLRPILWGAAGAITAFLLCLLAYTAWVDHQRITAVWDLELRRAAATTPGGK